MKNLTRTTLRTMALLALFVQFSGAQLVNNGSGIFFRAARESSPFPTPTVPT